MKEIRKSKSWYANKVPRDKKSTDIASLIPMVIPELKNMVVYIKPDSDKEKVRQEYIDRYRKSHDFKKK